MKKKLYFVTGVAVGYVLGSRAGRERYEQLKATATRAVGSSR
jgi:oxygen-dependent protoporphyrinogen oxidase